MNDKQKEILRKKAQIAMDAAYDFWKENSKYSGHAVRWLTDTEGKLLIFTRGEYKQQILENICKFGDDIIFERIDFEEEDE